MGDMLAMSDGDSASTYLTRICCSVCTFLTANFLWGVTCVFMIAVGVAGVLANDSKLVVLPPPIYFAFLAFGGLSTLIACCGACGQRMRIECFFLLYIFALALLLIAESVAYTFLFLYETDVAGFRLENSPIIDGDNILSSSLEDLAANNPAAWVTVQDNFDCCGITFEVGSANFDAADLALIDANNALDEETETGALCDGALLVGIRDQDVLLLNDDELFDANGNFIQAKENETIGFDADYYCLVVISENMETIRIITAVMVLLSLLFQFVALTAASRMYWVPEFLGGWLFDDEELAIVAARKGIAFPQGQQPQGGNRVLSALRAGTQRLSFRLQNAYTADPEVPKSAGFLNRLSLRRGAGAGSFRGVGEDGTYPPAQPGAPPGHQPQGMFNRISQRLFNIGGGAVIDLTQSEKGHTSQPPLPPGPPSSRKNRFSQKLSQGFSAMGSAFRRAPLPPQPPPQISSPGFGMPDPANNQQSASFGNPPSGPPPNMSSSRSMPKVSSNSGPPPAGGLLGQIRQGKSLNPTTTRDTSGPRI